MGYLEAWKVLEQMITDLRRRGLAIPASVIGDLRHARTLINVLRADPTHLDTGRKIEERLRSVESRLVSEGEKKFGSNYVKAWVERLDKASREVVDEGEGETTFIPGVPRNQRWIRVKSSDELPLDGLKKLAKELDILYNKQDDEYIVVYGKEERIKEFIKKMTEEYGVKPKDWA